MEFSVFAVQFSLRVGASDGPYLAVDFKFEVASPIPKGTYIQGNQDDMYAKVYRETYMQKSAGRHAKLGSVKKHGSPFSCSFPQCPQLRCT